MLFILTSAALMRSRYRAVLPDAEVKIQLALYKLERRHLLKVKKNDQHRNRMIELEVQRAHSSPRDEEPKADGLFKL